MSQSAVKGKCWQASSSLDLTSAFRSPELPIFSGWNTPEKSTSVFISPVRAVKLNVVFCVPPLVCGVFDPLKAAVVSSIRYSTSNFEETSGLERWGSLFIALQLPLWGASGNHSATLIERSRGQTFLFRLSLSFCLMNKSTFLHTCPPPTSPCKSKRWVQLLVCYWLKIFRDDARTVFLSSIVIICAEYGPTQSTSTTM